jgi:hypothetical protein
MHTKDKLAVALIEADLVEMAHKAATGWYHDFLSPLDLPTTQLIDDLAQAGTPKAMALRERVMEGDYDASPEEADEWARSPDGRDTFESLMRTGQAGFPPPWTSRPKS